MNLCSNGHEEVCYETRVCPACEKLKDADNDISKLNDKVETLESEVADLKKDLNDRS